MLRPDCNVQRDATSREYSYYILDGAEGSAIWRKYSCPSPGKLDLKAMNAACSLLLGEHDFVSFTSKLEPEMTNTVRTVYEARTRRKRPVIVFQVRASSFLPHQIRHTVSALIRVGLGKMEVAGFGRLLEGKVPEAAVGTAPAQGLYLMKVNYPDSFGEVS